MRWLVMLSVLAPVALPTTGGAATRTVTTLADDASASCLRTLINASAANDTIIFTNTLSGTITLTSELGIGRNLTILGPTNLSITVSGNNSNRVFLIGAPTVNISYLNISHGKVTGAKGTAGQDGETVRGGGIFVVLGTTLNLTNCNLTENHAVGGDGADAPTTGGGSAIGGCIYNEGTITLTDCALSGNSAVGGNGGAEHGGGYGWGGGIASVPVDGNSGIAQLARCTFSSNSVAGGRGGSSGSVTFLPGGGGDGLGGGVFSANNGTANLWINATFSGNTATGGDGGHADQANGGSGGRGLGGGVFIQSAVQPVIARAHLINALIG